MLKIILPIGIVFIIGGVYLFKKLSEEPKIVLPPSIEKQTEQKDNVSTEEARTISEQKATADENYVPNLEDIKNAKVTPENETTLEIEADPGALDKLSAPE